LKISRSTSLLLQSAEWSQAVREFSEAYGLEKSAIGEHFIEASRKKLKEMLERRLDKTRLCALLIDATPFQGQQMVAALGIGEDGRKAILGIRRGAVWETGWRRRWLHLPMQLRKTMAALTHGGDQRERWVGSGLLVAEKQFRRVQGYEHIPALIGELEALVPRKTVSNRTASEWLPEAYW
jgi:hypothetical protein